MIVDMKLKLHDTWITSHKGEDKDLRDVIINQYEM